MAVSPSVRLFYSYREHKNEWFWNSHGVDNGDGLFVWRFLSADRVTATAPTTSGERKGPAVLALAPSEAFSRSKRVDKRTKAQRSITDGPRRLDQLHLRCSHTCRADLDC